MTSSQLWLFVVCTACGVLFGPVYSLLRAIARLTRAPMLLPASDGLSLVLLAGWYLLLARRLLLPPLRLYMAAGCFLGLWLYAKSVHKSLAFFWNMLYNHYKRRRKARSKWHAGRKQPILRSGRKRRGDSR